MKKTMKYIGMVLSFLIATNTYAYHVVTSKTKKNNGQDDEIVGKAGCAAPTAKLIFEFNDVRAQLNTNGVLFYDRANNTAGYEVPKSESGLKYKAIFAASLWMGGIDDNLNLKLAGTTFTGNDFWTGPLEVNPFSGNYDPSMPVGDDAIRPTGFAKIDAPTCQAYDKYFTIRKAEVIAFINWYEWDVAGGVGEPVEKPNAEIMNRINNWPAHGGPLQDHYLAPFYDRPPFPGQQGDGEYNPADGDYPWYDDILGRDDIECGVDRRISLFGDETHWWVFNDAGNIHSGSFGEPIGMEIRAQAFSFATNDEINKMTFYNYEMINRGTIALNKTYFAQYVDADLGNPQDDYVGCDVSRGLGYAYNGDDDDEAANGNAGYGKFPPAIGVDFFEGPYQDADGRDNYGPYIDTLTGLPALMNVNAANNDDGIVYKGVGIGYNDGIIDNERFGMRRFTYYTNGAATAKADPSTAAQFYNYMSGKWRFGDEMVFGGTGFPGDPGSTTIGADYMFPGDSDPLFWSTKGQVTTLDWTEFNTGATPNPKGDRRFVQAAGPFTLRPGAINNITVGIVFAKGAESDLMSSVRALRNADTKAQALFDNCFEILDPPNAPVLKIQELENQLVLMINNPVQSNNFSEQYIQEDKVNIVDPLSGPPYDKFYRFEGYQIYQMKDGVASVGDIGDVSKARLVAQCDVKNNVGDLINYDFDEELGISIGKMKVKAANKGIKHTFKVTEDLFATGNKALVNHKKYYFIAVAYAQNQYKIYNPSDPTALDGQKQPYIASRINADGTAIRSMEAIPHNPSPELGGTVQTIGYGSTPRVTRLDGIGNGNNWMEFTKASLSTILNTGKMATPTYEYGQGPLNIKVVDPLNLVGGYFVCKFRDYPYPAGSKEYINYLATDTASWTIYRYDQEGGTLLDQVESQRTINFQNEQIIPQWGVSVEVYQKNYHLSNDKDEKPGIASIEAQRYTSPIGSSLTFADSSKRWLTFVKDDSQYFPTNWILSGTYKAEGNDTVSAVPLYTSPYLYSSEFNKDVNDQYISLVEGGIAPHGLVGYKAEFMPLAYPIGVGGFSQGDVTSIRQNHGISKESSIDIVFTNDKSLWTRCAVIELGREPLLNVGGAKPGTLRKSPSVDKNGNIIAGSTGMGWFPGYAIDIETGVRLHMAFGENSFLGSDNGADMIWNPSARLNDNSGRPIMGGQHAIYVFGYKIGNYNYASDCPEYDGVNNWVYDQLMTANQASFKKVYNALSWVVNPLLQQGRDLLSTDVKIKVRINKEYSEYTASGLNGGRPMYSWSMDDIRTQTGSKDRLAESLKLINVVPNPYYAFSTYETSRLDARVKITNLPDVCTVKIYNVSGKLIRTFKKDNPVTSIDWDMKNNKGIPIASGVYLIHVDVEGVGETIIKFFGGVRQPDLEGI